MQFTIATRTLQFSRTKKYSNNITIICPDESLTYYNGVQIIEADTHLTQMCGGNDPSITKAMRYSQYVRNAKPHQNTPTIG
jgi:hypothetical protein